MVVMVGLQRTPWRVPAASPGGAGAGGSARYSFSTVGEISRPGRI